MQTSILSSAVSKRRFASSVGASKSPDAGGFSFAFMARLNRNSEGYLLDGDSYFSRPVKFHGEDLWILYGNGTSLPLTNEALIHLEMLIANTKKIPNELRSQKLPEPPVKRSFYNERIWSRQGFVYLARNEGTGLVKIGFTENIKRRMRSLKSNHSTQEGPASIVLLGKKPGTRHDEDALHAAYSDFRKTGEWFHFDSKQIEEILLQMEASK